MPDYSYSFDAIIAIMQDIKEDTRETRAMVREQNSKLAKQGERIASIETKTEEFEEFVKASRADHRSELKRNRWVTTFISVLAGVVMWVLARFGFIPQP